MKKTQLFIAAAFVLATASAFTTKAFNVTGFAKDGLGNVVSAPTNEAGCAVNNTNDCSITVSGTVISPVYDAAIHIGSDAFILKFN